MAAKSSLWNRALRRARFTLFPGAVILCYHRVAELATDPFEIAVPPNLFAEHLEAIRQVGRPMLLKSFLAAYRAGQLQRRAVVITFDDGYAELASTVKPLLERHDVPATLFAVSGYLDGRREFWWDELERLLLVPGTLPVDLTLEVAGQAHAWSLRDAAHYSPAAAERDRGWRFNAPPLTARHEIFRALHTLIGPLPEVDREAALSDLRQWAGSAAAVRPTHRILSEAELRTLASNNLIEIGGHTVTHAMLPPQSAEARRREIVADKSRLEELLDQPITSFAYPYGWHDDATATAVREAGYEGACTIVPSPVRQRGLDPYRLPRIWARPWRGDELAAHIRAWHRGG